MEEFISNDIPFFELNTEKITPNNWVFVNPNDDEFLSLVSQNKTTLEEITSNIFQGPKSGADPVFILKKLKLEIEFANVIQDLCSQKLK